MKKSVKGSFLVAAPQLRDPNFERTVVLLAEHSEEGGFGLVLNRPWVPKVSALWEELTGESLSTDSPSYFGGPVETSALFLLHTCEDLAEGSDPVVPGLYLGNDQELLGALLEREKQLSEAGGTHEIYRVFRGYSGWGQGQLDRELETGSWLVQTASSEFVFSIPAEDLWARTMEREGGLYRLFARMPRHPELN